MLGICSSERHVSNTHIWVCHRHRDLELLLAAVSATLSPHTRIGACQASSRLCVYVVGWSSDLAVWSSTSESYE